MGIFGLQRTMAFFGMMPAWMAKPGRENRLSKSQVHLTQNIFVRFLKTAKEVFGSVRLAPVFIITIKNHFNILQQKRGLPIILSCLFMKIRMALFGLALQVG